MKRSELKSKIEDIITELLSEEAVAWEPSTKTQAKQQIKKSKLSTNAKADAEKEIDQNPSGIISNV